MRLIILAIVGIVLMGLGCVSSPPANTGDQSALPSTGMVTVSLKNFQFNPSALTINAGQTLHFVNEDGMTHDVAVIAADGTVVQPTVALNAGQTLNVTLTRAGDYRIECARHLPNMKGSVRVN